MRDQTYKTAKFWRTISYILVPILILPFGFLIILPFIADYISFDLDLTVYKWFFVPFSLIMLFMVIVAFANTVKGKLVISSNKIYTKGLFNNNQLYFNEIKGYRETEHFTYIESKNSNQKIKASNYYENGHEIFEWLKLNYKNLNEIEKNEDSVELLKNHEFGWTIEERERKLKTARKTAKTLNWLGGFVAIGTILLLNSFKYVIVLCIAYPVICLVVIIWFKGLIRIDDRSNNVYPTIFWAFFTTTSVLLFRGLVFFNIFDYTNIWLPTILIAFVFIFVLAINNREFIFYKAEKFSSIFMLFLIIIFGYSYGTVINLNCVSDNSKPQIFKTTILKKRINSDRITTYYLTLEKWNNQIESKEVSVTKDFYDKKNTNDSVTVNFRKGKFNISWFELNK